MKASDIIDYLYKRAEIIVPSKEEAKKENIPKKNLPTINCEVCGYNGETNDLGECPECKTIGGVKPRIKISDESSRNAIYDGEPRDGLTAYEADELGRVDESY